MILLSIQLIVGIAAPALFYQEAKRQGKPPLQWVLTAAGAYWGVYFIFALFLLPLTLALAGINLVESPTAQMWSELAAFTAGCVSLIVARTKLVADPKPE